MVQKVEVATKDQREFANVAAMARALLPEDSVPPRRGRLALIKVVARDLGVPIKDAANNPILHLHKFINKHRPQELVTPSRMVTLTNRPPINLARLWGANMDRLDGMPRLPGIESRRAA